MALCGAEREVSPHDGSAEEPTWSHHIRKRRQSSPVAASIVRAPMPKPYFRNCEWLPASASLPRRPLADHPRRGLELGASRAPLASPNGSPFISRATSPVGVLVQVRLRRWLTEEVVEASSPWRSPVVPLAGAERNAQDQSLDVFWDDTSGTPR